MKTDYCLGICPKCYGQGLIRPVKDDDKIIFVCDEEYNTFQNFQDISLRKTRYETILRDDYMELEDFLKEMPEMADHIYIYENGIWHNLKDKNKKLFQ